MIRIAVSEVTRSGIEETGVTSIFLEDLSILKVLSNSTQNEVSIFIHYLKTLEVNREFFWDFDFRL